MKVEDNIMTLIGPICGQKGVEVVEISYKREGPRYVLRILADKPKGITLDECGSLNNEIGQKLDAENIIEGSYVLEVSSPGLDRPIISRRDFERAMGRTLKVSTYAPFDGKNVFIGELLGISENAVVIQDAEGISTEIPMDKIARAKLHIEV